MMATLAFNELIKENSDLFAALITANLNDLKNRSIIPNFN